MLRQLRHISEGHYYGLRVTNNAEVEHLNKELRTLDACKNVQSHYYRKEEKDLVNTLVRLKKSKDHHVEEHFGRRVKQDDGHSMAHGLRTMQQLSRENIAYPPVPHTVYTSLVLPPNSGKQPPDHLAMPTEVGTEIHRTAGFIDCVICNLPRTSKVKGTAICTCDKGPDKGTHHMHPPAIHQDKTRPEYLTSRQKRELELEDGKHAKELKKSPDNEDEMFLRKLEQSMTQAIEQESGIVREPLYEKKAHSLPHKEESGYGERRNFLQKPRKGSQIEDERIRARQDSIYEEGPYNITITNRPGSLEDFRKRGPSFDYGIRERNESLGGESYYSVGELRSRATTLEDNSLFRKTYKIPQPPEHSPSHLERHLYENQHSNRRLSPSTREETHLPKITPQKEVNEAFNGLIHPDNIINHHHYLPYEADLSSGKQRHSDIYHSRHNDRHKRHLHGYYIHKYDHTGERQIMHIPIGPNQNVFEMIEKQHEPDSNHFALLSNLRQLLSVYQRMDHTSPKYPWPSPPITEITAEEFQKLKDCRYLRLPKGMEDAIRESPVFH